MENIGDIIRNHRMAKGLSQKELGDMLFVTKQAVSKWETGKTLPDIETIRKLCQILDIDKDEILGSSIEDTKKKRKLSKWLILIALISFFASVFFAFDGFGFITRRMQSGVAYLTVFVNGELIPAHEYQLSCDLASKNLKQGYRLDIDYGQIRGIVCLEDLYEIEFGFVNTNNWHNVHINLDITLDGPQISVRQTVSYLTNNECYNVTVTEGNTNGYKISVVRKGV